MLSALLQGNEQPLFAPGKMQIDGMYFGSDLKDQHDRLVLLT